MNSIPAAQNSARQIQRLAAQRQLYSTAKTAFGWQTIVSGPLAVGLAFVAACLPQTKGYIALWGLAVTMCDVVWLTPWQRRLRSLAARIQELFDCDVLVLPWDELKAGNKPDPELVNEQATKNEKYFARMPPLRDWYSPQVGALPVHLARLACQRSNCWWDAKQRRSYAAIVVVAVFAAFTAVLFAAMQQEVTIANFVLMVVAPLSPALVLGYRQVYEQIESAQRVDHLKDHASRLWNEALAGAGEADMTAKSRRLQSEILENRARNPLVFDALFRRLRTRYEKQMNYGVAELVAEANAAQVWQH